MMKLISDDKLLDVVGGHIPKGTGHVSLDLVSARVLCSDTSSDIVATLRLVTWEVENSDVHGVCRTPINIKEQEVFIAPLKYQWSEVLHYLEAWKRVLTDVMNVKDDRFAAVLPRDLTTFKTHPLELKGSGVDAYETALRHESRLGQWLDTPSP